MRKSWQRPNQTLLHIDLIQEHSESVVFYCPAFFKEGNNNSANEFVQESMGSHDDSNPKYLSVYLWFQSCQTYYINIAKKCLCNQFQSLYRIEATMLLPQIITYTVAIVKKKNGSTKEDKGSAMVQTLKLLWLVIRHLPGRSDIDCWRNQACSLSCSLVKLGWKH